MPISADTTPTVDLTVTAQHTRGALPRDPEVMRAYLESGRATDAVKVSKLCFFFCLLCAAFFLDFFCVAFASALVLSGNIWTDGATRRHHTRPSASRAERSLRHPVACHHFHGAIPTMCSTPSFHMAPVPSMRASVFTCAEESFFICSPGCFLPTACVIYVSLSMRTIVPFSIFHQSSALPPSKLLRRLRAGASAGGLLDSLASFLAGPPVVVFFCPSVSSARSLTLKPKPECSVPTPVSATAAVVAYIYATVETISSSHAYTRAW